MPWVCLGDHEFGLALGGPIGCECIDGWMANSVWDDGPLSAKHRTNLEFIHVPSIFNPESGERFLNFLVQLVLDFGYRENVEILIEFRERLVELIGRLFAKLFILAAQLKERWRYLGITHVCLHFGLV